MTELKPGVLMNLINGMNSGTKPTNEYRSSVLQVIDIVPIDLDEKDLYPKHGFYVKLSDSRHSVYVTLPYEKDDLVLSNKMQLGQFVYVDYLEPGLDFPVVRGVKPIPGRHDFVGKPETLLGFCEKSEKNDDLGCSRRRSSWVNGLKGEDSAKIRGSANVLASRRSFWGPSLGLKEESGLKLDERTPVKENQSLMTGFGSDEKMRRFNRRTSLLSKVIDISVPVKKTSVMNTPKSKSFRIFNSAGKKSVTPPSSRSTRTTSSPISCVEVKERSNVEVNSQVESPYAHSSSKTGLSFHLPQKLSLLGKEAVLQREKAQKVALQALRNASATETLVWSLKTLSTLTKSANPDDPTNCFDQFLDFHTQIVEAITDMVSIKAATETTKKEENTQTLDEIMNNNPDSNNTSKYNKSTLHKSIATFPGRSHQKSTTQKSTILGKHLSRVDQKGKLEPSCYKNENKKNDTVIKLGKQIEIEAGNWFMEFLEKALEKGMKKTSKKVPESLIMKVLKWVEVEQCDSNKRPVQHPRAIEIARKLRIKVKTT